MDAVHTASCISEKPKMRTRTKRVWKEKIESK